jgi:hypothetical protein
MASKLMLDWSPEQISKWLKVSYPKNESMRVFHETIYRSLFIQARGVLKKELSAPQVQAADTPLTTLALRDSPAVRSSMPSIFAKDLRRLKTALFPVIVRAICSQAAETVTSQPWWNDIRVSLCSSKCPAKTQHGRRRAEQARA